MSTTKLRLATEEDAVAIANTIRACYGDGYPMPEALSAEWTARAVASGSLVYAIAERDGELQGQLALARHEHGLYECGRAVVPPRHRNGGIMTELGTLLMEEGRKRGARYVFGRAVTNHVYTQRFGARLGLRPTGFLLGMCPDNCAPEGIERTQQPITALVHVRRLEPSPRLRRLALEGDDLVRARRILATLGVPASGEPLPQAPLGARVTRSSAFGGLAHIRFSTGAPPVDLRELVAEIEDARLVWADVPSEHAGAPHLIESLRELGLSFAAYLPIAGQRGEDVQRLQRYAGPPLRPELIQCIDEAAPLLREVLADESVLAASR